MPVHYSRLMTAIRKILHLVVGSFSTEISALRHAKQDSDKKNGAPSA